MEQPIKNLINGEIFFAQKDRTVLDVARYMSEKKIGALPVLDGDRVAGIFSERDLMTRVVVKNLDPGEIKVEEVMTKELVVGYPDESYEECIKKMQQNNCRHLPIVSENRLVGFVSLRDLLQVEIINKDEELGMLNAYVHQVPCYFTQGKG